MDDAYDNINDYNTKRNRKIFIVFDDMIADMNAIKKFRSIAKELFIRSRKLSTSLLFMTRYFFPVPKDVRLNSTHYLIRKIQNRKELENTATNHSAYIDYIYYMKI